ARHVTPAFQSRNDNRTASYQSAVGTIDNGIDKGLKQLKTKSAKTKKAKKTKK
ncbi:MAG: hypothetical protein ACI9W1_002346, partial [Candidatus Azotimanducaceae bacterium]